MRRTALHIALLLVLGLYYNGATAVWLAYSTVAKTFFIERCEDPTKPCCKGKCQVDRVADRSGSAEAGSGTSGTRIQIADPQPTIPTKVDLTPQISQQGTGTISSEDKPLSRIDEGPFRPPRA